MVHFQISGSVLFYSSTTHTHTISKQGTLIPYDTFPAVRVWSYPLLDVYSVHYSKTAVVHPGFCCTTAVVQQQKVLFSGQVCVRRAATASLADFSKRTDRCFRFVHDGNKE